MDIQQKISESNIQPTPPKLDIFNIDELLDPSFSQTMDDYDTFDPDIPTTTSTKKVCFDDNPEFITDEHKTHFDSTHKNTHTKTRPTTQTPIDHPNLLPADLPASCEQSNKQITEQQAH